MLYSIFLLRSDNFRKHTKFLLLQLLKLPETYVGLVYLIFNKTIDLDGYTLKFLLQDPVPGHSKRYSPDLSVDIRYTVDNFNE